MHGSRRKMKVVCMVAMVNIFLFIMLTRSGGQNKGADSKVHVPSKRFWAKMAPSSAFWNREQQKLDLLNNPVVTNSTGTVLLHMLDAFAPRPSQHPTSYYTLHTTPYTILHLKYYTLLYILPICSTTWSSPTPQVLLHTCDVFAPHILHPTPYCTSHIP